MKQIWDYVLDNRNNNIQTFEMPLNSKVLNVKNQNNKIVLYVMIDENHLKKPFQTKLFKVVVTGISFKNNYNNKYIDTVMLDNGLTSCHVFEVIL